jgi:glycosyltransferase involved in cell wall biosynthesis
VRVYGNPAPFPRYTARLRRLSRRDPRVQLAGEYHGQAELTDILRSLDVVVVPSLWYENSPNVILEAFAHGTPVIASNLGGMAELVEDGVNGLVFEPGNAGDLARQLRRLLTEPDLLQRLQAGIQPVKSVAQEMDELEAIYHAAMAGRGLEAL